MLIKQPYLLFLGDAHDQLAAKVAMGIKQWRLHHCIGQLRLPGCNADCGLPDIDIPTACAQGARTLVIGVANRGGVISDTWITVLSAALEHGMDIASGLHQRVADIPVLNALAQKHGRALLDVRHPQKPYPVASGTKRSGKRLLTVGTDCSVGKMYTALALEKELQKRNVSATFRATGQTGILISGSGVSVDAVVADFIAGAVETLTPANAASHWDIIEGQGSLFHPSFSGVSAGILHGAQADALVLCHEPTRKTLRGVEYPIPDIKACLDLHLRFARITSPHARFVGMSINTSACNVSAAEDVLKRFSQEYDLPCVDPVRNGIGPIADVILS